MFHIRYRLKPQIRKEIDYFKEWFNKSSNHNTKRKLYLHCMKLAKSKTSYEWRTLK